MAEEKKNIKAGSSSKESSASNTLLKTPAAEKSSSYGDNSIVQLKGADRVRKRPSVIFGSDGLDGCEHSFFEILSNSVDEAREGYGDRIDIVAYNDKSISVEDRGRGIPLDYNESEKQWNWYLIFCELYAGGKYKNNESDGAYEYALGLNGLGACATQCASEYMYVRSCNGSTVYEIDFSHGEPVSELRRREAGRSERHSGTYIRWKPDLMVFKDIDIPKEYYVEVLKRQAVVNSNIKFTLKFQNDDGSFEDSEYYYHNGIVDRINELTEDSKLCNVAFYKTETSGRDRADLPEYKLKAEIAFCFSQKTKAQEYYHNSSWLEHGGSPEKAAKQGFLSGFDKYLKDKGKYKKNESKITYVDIEDCLVLITNTFSTQTSYANQTKKAITNDFICSFLTDYIKRCLEIFFAENPADAEKAANQVLLNKRSRETAEATRLDIRKKLSGNNDIANRVDKFIGCRSKDPAVRELYIVEGDSAKTSCKLARNAEFQAIMPVRGKMLNCLKSSEDKIFKSEIITNLLKVIGCGVEIKIKSKNKDSEMSAFDLDSLKWSKIIICTDADEDGYQIRVLILTMFYRLLPTLLKEGRVYIAESPLYEINTKDKTLFAYSESEKNEIIKSLDKQKYVLQRSKGLGENEAEMMSLTTMNPASRRLIRVCPDDASRTAEMFELMIGDNLEGRKDFIARYGSKYISVADI